MPTRTKKQNAPRATKKSYKRKPVAFRKSPWTSGTPVPYRYVKFNYVNTLSFTASTTIGLQRYALNSLYDPNSSGTGHQPKGYTQWSAFYYRYLVTGVKIEIRLLSTGEAGVIGFAPHNASSDIGTSSTLQSLIENKWTTYKMIPSNNNRPIIIKKYLPIDKILGITRRKLTDDDMYTALFTGSPADIVYATIFGQASDKLSNFSVNGEVRLTFYSKLFDPKILPQSGL